MSKLRSPERTGWITPEPLNLSPQLVGLPLARPSRRAFAMAVDLLLVALLTGVSGAWLLGGLALVVLQLRSRRGSATGGRRAAWGWAGAAVILLLVLQEGRQQWDEWRHPGKSPAAEQAEAAQDVKDALGEAADALQAQDTATVAAAGAAAGTAAMSDRERIVVLEAELAEARRPKVVRLRDRVSGFLDDIGAGLGWGIVYFSLLPAWWGGQTVGKKLFGLQVVELTGKPMTVMRCLKRYGGYAAGLATGGVGFLQVLWDPNRQGLHDKAAHTAVIDLRAPCRQAASTTLPPSPP